MSVRVLRCPACDAAMNSVGRRGVVIDVCQDCKGVFLDRGELDKLLDAAAVVEQAPLAAEADRLSRRPYGDDDDDDETAKGVAARVASAAVAASWATCSTSTDRTLSLRGALATAAGRAGFGGVGPFHEGADELREPVVRGGGQLELPAPG